MSSSYYYPYFSARTIQPHILSAYEPSLSSLYRQKDLLEIQLTQKKIRQKQQMLYYQKIKDYQLQLRVKRRLNDIKINDQRQELDYMNRQQQRIQQIKNIQHFKHKQNTKIQQKKRQQHIQKQNFDYNQAQTKDYEEQKYNQKIIKQYQNELLRKINQSKKDKILNENTKKKGKMAIKQQSLKNDKIINKKKKSDFVYAENKYNKKEDKDKINYKNKDSLKNQLLSNYETLDHPIESRKRGQTIDFSEQIIHIKTKTNKTKSNKHCSQSKHKNKSKISFIAKQSLNQSINPKFISLKRIKNRLKLSMIVFKDSKMRNKRYEIDHIINKFENENKLRKQIKDKINNNPQVLKKQSLVVDSR